MRKVFKIVLVLFAIVIIVGVVFAAIIFLDLAAYAATSSETLTATGDIAGNALVVYDPGLSGAAKDVANKIALNLQSNGYTVDFAGVKSRTAENPTGYNIIVAGGPIYAGAPTNSVKNFLSSLGTAQGVKVGVFGSGSGSEAQEDLDQIKNAISTLPNGDALSDALIAKIGVNEDINTRTFDFVINLIE